MNLIKFSYSKKYIKFKEPFHLNKDISSSRVIYIIKLTDTHNNIGYGECSPYPQLNDESEADIEFFLKQINNKYSELSKFKTDCAQCFANHSKNFYSLKFGLDMACINYEINKNKQSLKSHFGIKNNHIRCNALLHTDPKAWFASVHSFVKIGFKTVKVKVGFDNIKYEVKQLEKIHQHHPHIEFRLDFNTRLSINKVIDYAMLCKNLPIDYVEEPGQTLSDYDIFFKKTHLKFGIDTIFDHSLCSHKGCTAIIIKPMAYGDINKLFKLKKDYPQKRIIISSSYQDELGIQFLAHLAATINPMDDHGLATQCYFKNTTLTKPTINLQE